MNAAPPDEPGADGDDDSANDAARAWRDAAPFTGAKDATAPSAARRLDRGKGRGPSVLEIAERVLEKHRLLRDSAGDLWEYVGPAWRAIGPHDLESIVYAACGWSASAARSEVAKLVGVSVHRPGVAAPCWLGDGNDRPPATEFLPGRNSLFHMPTRELWPPSPDLFITAALPFDFDPAARAPAEWLRFLDTILGGRPETVALLGEWFGYALTSSTVQHKALLIVGPKRSGKGTIARVLRALVGPDAYAGVTLGGLADRFGLEPLIGRRLAVVADARIGGRADQATMAERLLAISGEDALAIDRKYKPAWHGRIGVRFVVLTNELPKVADASGTLASRFLVIRLTESFYGRENLELEAKLLAELPGILTWALDGYDRLRQRGRFSDAGAGGDDARELAELGSPVLAFVRDRCVVECSADATVSCADLFAAWRAWCESVGHLAVGNAATFGRDLRAALPHVTVVRPRGDHARSRYYVGVTLTT